MRQPQKREPQAGEAAATIEEVLQKLRGSKRDWATLFAAIRLDYYRLWSTDLIRNDLQARTIMRSLAACRSFPSLQKEFGKLRARVSELLAKQNQRRKTPLGLAPASARPRQPGLDERSDHLQGRAPRRTILRL